jgi:hypothetical protein
MMAVTDNTRYLNKLISLKNAVKLETTDYEYIFKIGFRFYFEDGRSEYYELYGVDLEGIDINLFEMPEAFAEYINKVMRRIK